jgi:hypothetical protein
MTKLTNQQQDTQINVKYFRPILIAKEIKSFHKHNPIKAIYSTDFSFSGPSSVLTIAYQLLIDFKS